MSEPLSDRALERLLSVAREDEPAPTPTLPARYEFVAELGRGGMGIVYEVIDHQLGRRCALKTMTAMAGSEHELRRRFAREALAAARLRHPHIATVYDATPDYISMQLIVGCPIDALHREERRSLVEIVRDAARAVQHAHEQGIVHRDLKPSNLLVEGRHVFVVDFGLAKEIAADASLSIAGAVLGTPAFMPPEQAMGRMDAVDARSDVYSLGATLYHCLVGQPPFCADELPTLLRRLIDDDAKPAGVDAELDLVIAKCLSKEPVQRYQTADALADDLDRWLLQQPVSARRPSLLYRWRKRLQRQRSLWRAAGIAALLVALILVPIALRESAARSAASEAVELADHTATILADATVFFRQGENANAIEVLDYGIARAKDFLARHEIPRAHYLLARLLRAAGRPDDALAQLETALTGDATLLDARFERGLLVAERSSSTPDELRMAIADLSTDVERRSVLTATDQLFGRAELARIRGEYELAMELCQEVLEYDAANVPARLAMGRSALALGMNDLARYYTAGALDLQMGYGPVYVARERQSLPTMLRGLDGALIDFGDALRDSPDNALALAYRGIATLRRALRLAREDKLAEAITAIDAAIADHVAILQIHDGLAGALNNRAVCRLVADRLLARAGDTAGAADHRHEAATELAAARAGLPERPEPPFNRGRLALREREILLALGRRDTALAAAATAVASFTEALALAPKSWIHAAACETGLATARTRH